MYQYFNPGHLTSDVIKAMYVRKDHGCHASFYVGPPQCLAARPYTAPGKTLQFSLLCRKLQAAAI